MYGSYYSSSVPRSHYYPTSDGSDSGSPGGGGGGNAPSSSSYNSQSSSQLGYNRGNSHGQPQEDLPYSPSRPSLSQVPSTSTHDFVLPPEHQLSGAVHGATPVFSGDSQYSGTVGQYQPYHGNAQHGHTFPSSCTYAQPHAGFVTLSAPSYPNPSHPPPLQSSSQSRYSGTVAPAALQIQALSQFPDAGDYLRHQLGLPLGSSVSLDCLQDPPPGRKPSQAYPILIKLAIYGSPEKRLTLKGIFEAIESRFEYFRMERSGAWKRSIRHNLSLNKVFRNMPRPITEPGKGSYWELDISQGEGYKRERKRRKKTTVSRLAPRGQYESDLESPSGDDEEESETSSPSRSQSPGQRAGAIEVGGVGPFRSTLAAPSARRSSPYPGGEVPVRARSSSRTQTAEATSTASPTWSADPRGPSQTGIQNPQAHYHQPQPYGIVPQPPPAAVDAESLQTMFRSTPFAYTMAWHAQQHMAQQQAPRSASVSSQVSHASSMSSSVSATSGGYGQPGHSSTTQGLAGGMKVQYQGFGQPGQEAPSEGSKECDSQGAQSDNSRYRA